MVAMGSDSIVDLLARTAMIAEAKVGVRPVTQGMLASWKVLLAARTETHATYLAMSLHRWQRQHNARPDLTHDVTLQLAKEGAGTVLLSASQAALLERALNNLNLHGYCLVEVLGEGSKTLGSPILLRVAGNDIRLPADHQDGFALPDLGPAMLLLAGLLCAIPVLPSQGGMSVTTAIPAVAWYVGAACWGHRQTFRSAPSAHTKLFLAGLSGCLLYSISVVATLRLRAHSNPPYSFYPFLCQVGLTYVCHEHLPASLRRLGIGAALASSLIASVFNQPSRREVALSSLWVPVALLPTRGLPAALGDQERAAGRALEAHDALERHQAFRVGQEDVWSLVANTLSELRRFVNEHRGELALGDLEVLDRRMDEVGLRLAAERDRM